jgi:Holliday junction resolvase RusA-like endonuclease
MSMSFSFVLDGPPVPKQRARKTLRNRFYTPEETARFEQRVAWAARAALPFGWPVDSEYVVTVTAFFPTRRRIDADNVLKAVQDALNPLRRKRRVVGPAFVWKDDSQVSDSIVRRRFDSERPRTEVTIEVREAKACNSCELYVLTGQPCSEHAAKKARRA